MKLKSLTPHELNPRKITDRKLELLRTSLRKYGDLSGFVLNRTTGKLVSGHQRQKAFSEGSIVIEEEFDAPTQSMTVAHGYVEIDGERFSYREVEADEKWEMEAIIAANKHGGEFDKKLLKKAIQSVDAFDYLSAGIDMQDLKPLGLEIPDVEIEEYEVESPLEPKEEPQDEKDSSPDRGEESRKDNAGGEKEESDEQYLKNEAKESQEIDVEHNAGPPNPKGIQAKWILAITCPDQETGEKLKAEIQAIVKELGCEL